MAMNAIFKTKLKRKGAYDEADDDETIHRIEANTEPNSEFHGMLNTDKIGTTVHSQGGGFFYQRRLQAVFPIIFCQASSGSAGLHLVLPA